MKRLTFLMLAFFMLAAWFPHHVSSQGSEQMTLEGNIVAVQETNEGKKLQVKIYKGSKKGELIDILHNPDSRSTNFDYSPGDRVVVMAVEGMDGSKIYYITDYVRTNGIAFLFIVFVVMAVLIGGLWGATSLLGMLFSFFIIFQFILPQMLDGKNAVFVAILGASIIIPVTFSLSHGFNVKTMIASAGTVMTLAITGVLSLFAVNITYLSGFGSEEVSFLANQMGNRLNPRGLLLAGMIISSLGILDDITISQASIVKELKEANQKYKFAKLFSKAMNVGRDHISSLINTLVLVYTGASLPLLLLFIDSDSNFLQVLNIEMIAEEVVRTLVGSMGLILAVPITTFFAAYYYSKKHKSFKAK